MKRFLVAIIVLALLCVYIVPGAYSYAVESGLQELYEDLSIEVLSPEDPVETENQLLEENTAKPPEEDPGPADDPAGDPVNDPPTDPSGDLGEDPGEDSTVDPADDLTDDPIAEPGEELEDPFGAPPVDMDMMALGEELFAFAPGDPFEIDVVFPGVDGVKLEYYTNTKGWVFVGFFNDAGTVNIPVADQATFGSTTIRASKGPMIFTFTRDNNELDILTVSGTPLEVPVIPIRVFGLPFDCNIGISQGGWVYSTASFPGGTYQLYNVFDNGGTYTIQLTKTGFFPINITVDSNIKTSTGTGDELWAYFSNFYWTVVPAGITDVQAQSNDYIQPSPANDGDTIALLADYGNIRDAGMTFVYNGVTYSVNFTLDGSDPFAFSVNYDGNGNDIGFAPFDPGSPYRFGETVKVESKGSLDKTGYTFTGWNTAADGSGTSYNAGDFFTMPDGVSFTQPVTQTLYAQWADAQTTYVVRYYYMGTSIPLAAAKNGTGNIGDSVTENAITIPGFTALAPVSDTQTLAAAGNVFVFYYAISRHDISYVYDDGSGSYIAPSGAPALPAGETGVAFLSLRSVAPQPALAGYTFAGWTTTGATVVANQFLMPDSDVVFSGYWVPVPYTITYVNSYGNPNASLTSYTIEDTALAMKNPSRNGYRFLGWTVEYSAVNGDTSLNILANTRPYSLPAGAYGDVVLTAHWSRVSSSGGGAATAASGPAAPAGNPPPRPEDTSPTIGIPPADVPLQNPAQTVSTAGGAPEQSIITIAPERTPLGEGQGTGSWSLLNLVLSIAAGMIMVVLLVSYFHWRDDEIANTLYYRRKLNKHLGARLLSIVTTAAAILLFVLTQDMTRQMVLYDGWTIWHIVILAAAVVLAGVSRTTYETEEFSANYIK